MIRILIVDDNSQNLYMLETILKGHGYQTVSAKNGMEALDEAMRHPPNLIVTDILMPVMDGFMLCQQWKKRDELKNIPFIFYTATYTDPKDEQFALSLGADRFVVKPQKPEVLVDIIEDVLTEIDQRTAVHTRIPVESEERILEEYNEVLFRKLQKKVKELEIDIAERISVELALRKSEEMFRKVFESNAVGIAILDPAAKFLRINEEYCRMLGYSEEDLIDKNVLDVTHPDHHQEVIDCIRRLKMENLPVYASEKRSIKKDGSIVWSMTNVSVIHDQGDIPIFFIVFANDITEQKILQEHERQALHQIERNLEQLATLNDQIRNPLSIIVALLMSEKRTKTTEQMMDAVRSIDDIVKKLDRGWAESAKVREFLERHNQITRRT